MTILDYVLTVGISLWLIAAVCYIIRQKKAGRSVSCGGNCGSCSGCQNHCSQAGVKHEDSGSC